MDIYRTPPEGGWYIESLRAFRRADLDFRSYLLIGIRQESVSRISQLWAFDEMFWLSWQMGTCQTGMRGLGRSLGVPRGIPGVPWRSWGVPRDVLGVSLRVPGGSQGAPKTEVVLWGCTGMVLGGPWAGFGGMGRSLGQSWEVSMLLFRLFQMVFWYAIFSNICYGYLEAMLFSWKTKKQKNSFYMDYGRSTCCYFVGFSNDSWNTSIFAGAFSMNSFKISMEKPCALVEPKSWKQWKSLCNSDDSCFPGAFGS